MNQRNEQKTDTGIQFSSLVKTLRCEDVVQYAGNTELSAADVPGQVNAALQAPIDFPPLEAAIVSGDHVALAVDPNVPQLCDVLLGVMKTIGATDAGEVDIVLWDEASDATIADVKDAVGESANVVRHESSVRESLRYLGADNDADPIYFSRPIVDADFVLPIIATRPRDGATQNDLTGIFPLLADSHTRARFREKNAWSEESQVAMMIGAQLILTITTNADGHVGEITASTIYAAQKKITPTFDAASDSGAPQPLVIASLDGGSQQQTWANAARAIVAASHYAENEGTIVLWSDITAPPTGALAQINNEPGFDEPPSEDERGDNEDFAPWDASIELAKSIGRIATEYRIMIHSKLDRETIETMGLGAVESSDELAQLSQTFDGCGVLQAAQFAGATHCKVIQNQ